MNIHISQYQMQFKEEGGVLGDNRNWKQLVK